jgi:hypothetical protein
LRTAKEKLVYTGSEFALVFDVGCQGGGQLIERTVFNVDHGWRWQHGALGLGEAGDRLVDIDIPVLDADLWRRTLGDWSAPGQ